MTSLKSVPEIVREPFKALHELGANPRLVGTGSKQKVQFDTPFGDRYVKIPTKTGEAAVPFLSENIKHQFERAVRGSVDPAVAATPGVLVEPATQEAIERFKARCLKRLDQRGRNSDMAATRAAAAKAQSAKPPAGSDDTVAGVNARLERIEKHLAVLSTAAELHEERRSVAMEKTARQVEKMAELLLRIASGDGRVTLAKSAPVKDTAPEQQDVAESPIQFPANWTATKAGDDVVTAEEAARICGLTLSGWYQRRMRKAAPSPVRAEGNRHYWQRSDVEACRDGKTKWKSTDLPKSLLPDPKPGETEVDTERAAELAGMTKAAFYTACHDGRGPKAVGRRGKRKVYRTSDVLAFRAGGARLNGASLNGARQ